VKEILVISGKGGTGKTFVTGSFAALASSAVFADCDVDAANLELIMRAEIEERHEFKASRKAFIDPDICTRCGLCQSLCRFGAISDELKVDPVSCEGCGVCYHACPVDAVNMKEIVSGHWFVSRTPYGYLVHARLGPAEENSGKLVAAVRSKAKDIARSTGARWLISDGPPGIGCPVMASMAGVSAALVVTEPSLTGIHDLKRVLELCNHFQVRPFVCINRWDLDEGNASRLEETCFRLSVKVVGKIAFDRVVTDSMVRGIPLVEHSDGLVSRQVRSVWESLTAEVDSVQES